MRITEKHLRKIIKEELMREDDSQMRSVADMLKKRRASFDFEFNKALNSAKIKEDVEFSTRFGTISDQVFIIVSIKNRLSTARDFSEEMTDTIDAAITSAAVQLDMKSGELDRIYAWEAVSRHSSYLKDMVGATAPDPTDPFFRDAKIFYAVQPGVTAKREPGYLDRLANYLSGS